MEVTDAAFNAVRILVAVIAGLVAIIAPIALTVHLILRPIDRAAKLHNAPPRFSVGDFLCLFLAIQIPLAAISRLVEPAERNTFWLFTIATWMIGPLTWITCARTLSKAGVVKSLHRLMFMGFVMPVVYYGLFPFTWLSVNIVLLAYGGRDPRTPTNWVFGSWSLLALLLILSWYFTKYIVGQIEQPGAELSSQPEENIANLQTPDRQAPIDAQVTVVN